MTYIVSSGALNSTHYHYFAICSKMSALRHSKRHHNIETETVVRLAFKLMRVAYGEFYDRFCAVI